MTAGLAPTAFTTAWADWAMHLALSPAKQMEMQQQLLERAQDTWSFALRALAGQPVAPAEGLDGQADRRFAAADWSQFPFNVYARAYQNNAALMNDAVRDVDGVTDYHAQLLEFAVRMLLDASSPAELPGVEPRGAGADPGRAGAEPGARAAAHGRGCADARSRARRRPAPRTSRSARCWP